jgi:hypothetical protein
MSQWLGEELMGVEGKVIPHIDSFGEAKSLLLLQ